MLTCLMLSQRSLQLFSFISICYPIGFDGRTGLEVIRSHACLQDVLVEVRLKKEGLESGVRPGFPSARWLPLAFGGQCPPQELRRSPEAWLWAGSLPVRCVLFPSLAPCLREEQCGERGIGVSIHRGLGYRLWWSAHCHRSAWLCAPPMQSPITAIPSLFREHLGLELSHCLTTFRVFAPGCGSCLSLLCEAVT